MENKKGKPFLEILASTIHEDYRFPIMEAFAFLYVLGTFVFGSLTSTSIGFVLQTTQQVRAFNLATSLAGAVSLPMFIFVFLILKNIAYGLGKDLENGTIQTYFTYPLKRSGILFAKLISAIGIALILFVAVQISALFILAPELVSSHFDVILLTYAANLSYPLLIAGIVMVAAMVLRRGGLSLVIGILLYFGLYIGAAIASALSYSLKSALPAQILSIFLPGNLLSAYYSSSNLFFGYFWKPGLSDVLISVGASYAIVIALFVTGYYYFSRRLNL